MDRNTENQLSGCRILKKASLALLIALFVTLANALQAQTPLNDPADDTGWLFSASKIYAGKKLEASDNKDISGETLSFTFNGNTITGSAAVVATDAKTGDFTLSNMTITGGATNSTDELIGFLYVTQGTALDAFAANILGSANITVENTGKGAAYGAFFRNVDRSDVGGSPDSLLNSKWADIAGNLALGTITVTSTDTAEEAGVTGFVAGDIKNTAAVTLGNITATSATWASGIQIDNLSNGTLNVGNITTVTTDGEANGIRIDGDFVHKGNIGTINVTSENANTYGIHVAGELVTFTIRNNITATSSNGNPAGTGTSEGIAYGFFVDNDLVASGINITGTTTNITAISDYRAYGFNVTGMIADSNVTLGNITVQGGNTGEAGAIGFGAGNVSDPGVSDTSAVEGNSSIKLGNIYAKGNVAIGAFFDGDVIGSGKIEIADIKVEAGQLGGQGIRVQNGDLTAPASFGKIEVTSTGTADSFGINVTGGADLTLKDNINVTAGGNNTSGIRTAGNTSIKLDNAGKKVDISAASSSGGWAGADIWTSNGNLSINLNANELTTNKVKVDGSNNLNITGNGRAELGIVEMTGNGALNIGSGTNNTVVSLDIVNSKLGGVNSITPDATLEIYGVPVGNFSPVNFGQNLTDANFVYSNSESVYWILNNGVISFGGLRENVNISDGFLAAFGIHNRYTVWNAVRDRMISGNGYGYRAGYYGQSACRSCASQHSAYSYPAYDCISQNVWVNYVGRSNSFGSSFGGYNGRNWKLLTHGVQTGADMLKTPRDQFGILFGYEGGKMTNTGDRVNAEDLYLGAYGATVFRGGADLRGSFAYGWQDYKMRRSSNDRIDRYRSTFNGNTMEGTIELGKRSALGLGSVRPVFAVDVLDNNISGAREASNTGNSPFAYSKTSLTQVFVRTGSDLRWAVNYFTFNGGVYYSYDVNNANGSAMKTSVTAAQRTANLVGTKPGRSFLTFNAGGEVQLDYYLWAIVGYQGEYALDGGSKSIQNTGYIGGLWKW